MPEALVGLDVGTSGVKGIALSGDGEVLAVAEEPYPLSTPHPGWSEQEPEDWWRAAQVVLVVNSRGDALETCFACYRQLFASGHGFSYDLDHMTSYWRDYDRLCGHWQRLFPQRFLEHAHASMQADPEAQVRRLLAFCGLDYDPACLAVHREQPISHSAPYAGELKRLRVLLGTA